MAGLWTLSGCAKPYPGEPAVKAEVDYLIIDKTLTAVDTRPVIIDFDKDGRVDVYLSIQLVSDNKGTHMHVVANTLGRSAIKMMPYDDEQFLNAGDITAFKNRDSVDGVLRGREQWGEEYGVLFIRTTNNYGTTSWSKHWASGAQRAFGVKLLVNGKTHYGWVRAHIDRNKETLTVEDCAWNKLPDEPLLAGVIR